MIQAYDTSIMQARLTGKSKGNLKSHGTRTNIDFMFDDPTVRVGIPDLLVRTIPFFGQTFLQGQN